MPAPMSAGAADGLQRHTSEAARQLGMHRRSLQRELSQYPRAQKARELATPCRSLSEEQRQHAPEVIAPRTPVVSARRLGPFNGAAELP